MEKITKITLILCVLALVGCGANVFCAGPRGLPSPFSCLVSELWPIPPDRLVGAPTDDGDLHHARGAWERPKLAAVHVLASLSRTWATKNNGGRWQKREEWREERASPNDSFSSSESSDAEDADIDRKMDALLQGSQKVAIVSHSYL